MDNNLKRKTYIIQMLEYGIDIAKFKLKIRNKQ